eukprot:1831602-Amphidinium_carterae.1
MVKAVPGFLQVSDLLRWLMSNTVALFSGTARSADYALRHLTPSSKPTPRQTPMALNKSQMAHSYYTI